MGPNPVCNEHLANLRYEGHQTRLTCLLPYYFATDSSAPFVTSHRRVLLFD